MNPIENYYKIQCALLSEQKKNLANELRILEEEGAGNVASNVPPQQSAQQTQQPQRVVGKKGKVGAKKGKPFEGSYGSQNQEGPTPFMGLAATPQVDAARKALLSQYYDNPTTPNIEVPNEMNWQGINQSVGNYMADQLRQLKRQQGMAESTMSKREEYRQNYYKNLCEQLMEKINLLEKSLKHRKMKHATKKKLDPVGKEDSDIDNDGVPNTKADKYLKHRREVRAKQIAKKKKSEPMSENSVIGGGEVLYGGFPRVKDLAETVDFDFADKLKTWYDKSKKIEAAMSMAKKHGDEKKYAEAKKALAEHDKTRPVRKGEHPYKGDSYAPGTNIDSSKEGT